MVTAISRRQTEMLILFLVLIYCYLLNIPCLLRLPVCPLLEIRTHRAYATQHPAFSPCFWPRYSLELIDLFEVDKQGPGGYDASAGNKMLLWHGSRLTNWAGILSQGLRIAPPEAPCTGYSRSAGAVSQQSRIQCAVNASCHGVAPVFMSYVLFPIWRHLDC